jgi:hypothetical protein
MLLRFRGSLALAVACLAGMSILMTVACGYRMGPRPCDSPVTAENIFIPLFQNQSFEPRLENLFTMAFRERIQALSCVSLASRKQADALLKGKILSVDQYRAAVDEEFFAVEYRMRVVLSVSLERSGDGEVLWQADMLEDEVSFYASSDPLLQKDNREEALMKLSSRMSAKVVDRLMLGF